MIRAVREGNLADGMFLLCRAGGGVNIGQLKVCFTGKELVIGPNL